MTMLTFIVGWSLFFLGLALALNVIAFASHLASWNLYTRESEKLGFFVFLFIIVVDILYLILCKVPLVHRDWSHAQFLFGKGLCQWSLVLETAFSLAQFITICFYLASIWLRLRRRIGSTATVVSPQNTTSVKEGFILISCSLSLSIIIGVVVTYRLSIDRDWNPSIENGEKCSAEWHSSFWLTLFRWTLGFFGPLGLLATPALIQFIRLRNRINRKLGVYIGLSVSILVTQCMLIIPALIMEINRWTGYFMDRGSDERGSGLVDEDIAAYANEFVAYVLESVLPELQYLFIPIGVLILLPGSNSSLCGRKMREASKAKSQSKSVLSEFDYEDLERRQFLLGKSQPELRTSDIDRHDEDDEDKIVRADIHQRLSKSQTTVV